MTYQVRTLRQEELRAASDVFAGSLHRPPISDEVWQQLEPAMEPGRTFGALDESGVIGTAWSFRTEMAVPGGARVPTAAVSRVGVRADRTRRGVLTSLIRAQLTAAAEAGEALASLHASEAVIYGRFGYGVATRDCTRTIDKRMAGMRTGEVGGELRLLNTEALFDELPGVYRRIGLRRPGMIDRPDRWWTLIRQFMTRGDRNLVGVLHGPHGVEDGFVTYHVDRGERSVLNVHDLFAANDEAYRDLLRFVLGVDLVAEVRFGPSPLDAPVELLLTDRRACRVTEVEDETWLRLVDVPAALAARDYVAGEPVSIGVRDPLLPANSGTYRIGAHGVERMDTEPDLRCDVDTVATMYLGDVPASALATAGRIEVSEPKAPARADALFASPVSPWCGTFY